MAAFNENTDLQFCQLCILTKKTSLGATQGARQIQTRCCKMARALRSQLPRDLKVLDMSQKTLSYFCGTTCIQTVICRPLKGEIVLKPRYFNMLPQTFREISVLLVSVWMKTELREEKVTLKITLLIHF